MSVLSPGHSSFWSKKFKFSLYEQGNLLQVERDQNRFSNEESFEIV